VLGLNLSQGASSPPLASAPPVTLDPDIAARLRQVARQRGISFKKALNAVLRAGLGAPGVSRETYRGKRALLAFAGV
jgi:hypothetical protein